MNKNVQGIISIFLALIILPVYSISLIAMDIVNIASTNNKLKISNELAVDSVLSKYDKNLYKKFGIYGFDNEDGYLNDYAKYILTANIEEGDFNTNTQLENFDIIFDENNLLIKTNNLEKQILDYMSLHGPYKLANGAVNLINISMEAKEANKVIQKKMDYEKDYSKLNNNLDMLVKNFSAYEEKFTPINTKLSKVAENYTNLKKNITENNILDRYKLSNDLFNNLTSQEEINTISNSKLTEDSISKIYNIYEEIKKTDRLEENKAIIESQKVFLSELLSLSKRWTIDDKYQVNDSDFDISVALGKIEVFTNNINYANNNTIKQIISNYNQSNQRLKTDLVLAKVIVEDIIWQLQVLANDTENIQEKLEIWKNSINTLDNSQIKNNFLAEYRAATRQFTKENIESLLGKMNEISDRVNKNIDYLNVNDQMIIVKVANIEQIKNSELAKLEDYKLSSLNNYKIYKYAMEVAAEDKLDNENKKIAKENKSKIEKFSNKISETQGKVENASIHDYISTDEIASMTNSSLADLSLSPSSNLNNFTKIFSSLNSLIPDKSNNLVENLYLAQYLVDKFPNKLTEGEGFTNQLEYILFGKSSLQADNDKVRNYIFALRFLLNSIYAYSNSDLKLEANVIATSIAGWTGFGVPLLRTLLLSSMSFGESVLDIEKLNNNLNLESFKNKSTWQVSIASLPQLLAKGIKETAISSIDNIYDDLTKLAESGVDNLEAKVNDFANQTIDGVSQTIIAEILSPIQVAIFDGVNKKVDDIKSLVNEVFTDVEYTIISDGSDLFLIKKNIFEYIKGQVNSLVNNIDSVNIENEFSKIRLTIEAKIRDSLSNKSDVLKDKIKASLSENKILQKKKIGESIDKFLISIGAEELKMKHSTSSGLSFKYKDYLLLLCLFRLMSTDKDAILSRMAILMNYEIKKEDTDFDIRKLYCRIAINTEARVNTFILKKYIFIDNIKQNHIGAY